MHLVFASYQAEPELTEVRDGMTLHSLRAAPNVGAFYASLLQIASDIKPDVVIAFSDTWYGILGARIANAVDCKLVIDAYDNYEAYISWAKPLHWLWRKALRRADGITAAGPQLLEMLCRYGKDTSSAIVPMAADPLFEPLPLIQSREALGLPTDRKLIGYLGTADRTRGFDLFINAIEQLELKRLDYGVVLSGRNHAELTLPEHRLHRMGYVEDANMPLLINSCDLLVCINKDSAFGNFSYPVKIYEALACERPVLASDTAPARWILCDTNSLLTPLGDAHKMASKMSYLLDNPVTLQESRSTWEASSLILQKLLADI